MEVAGVILHRLRGVRVSAAVAAVPVEARAGAVRAVRAVPARVLVPAVGKAIVRVLPGAAAATVTPRERATAGVPEANTRPVQAAETIRPFQNPARAPADQVQVLLSTVAPRGPGKRRAANRISPSTRSLAILRLLSGMIRIGEQRRRSLPRPVAPIAERFMCRAQL